MSLAFILNFHGIGVPDRPLDVGEGPYWISEQTLIDILNYIKEEQLYRMVGITFDDGNRSDVDIALPVLKSAGITAKFFVLAGRIGSKGFLSSQDISTLERHGMTIGSHGFAHVDWRSLDAGGRQRELLDSRTKLQSLCGSSVTDVAVPFGAYNRVVLGHIAAAGYTSVYTSDGGRAGKGPIFARTSVRQDMDLASIRALLHGNEALGLRLRRATSILRKRLF